MSEIDHRKSARRRSFRSRVFSSAVASRKSEVFRSEVESRRWEVGSQKSEVGRRTRERDGGLQPPIERLVYIYIQTYISTELAPQVV